MTNQNKIFYIYEIKNLINGKTYIGKHISKSLPDSYLGSGVYLRRAIQKYGRENFQKTIICFAENKKDLSEKEVYYIAKEKSKGKAEYNLTWGGEGGDTLSLRDQKSNKERSEKLKMYWATDGHIEQRNLKSKETWQNKTREELDCFRKHHSKYLYRLKGEQEYMTLRELSDKVGMSVYAINMAAKTGTKTRLGFYVEREEKEKIEML